MDLAESIAITGGLSKPGKMPGPSYNLPASNCHVGSKLVNTPGTVCNACYALRGRYGTAGVIVAMDRRLRALDDPRWTDAMTFLVGRQASRSGVMRWHDSGDLQSVEHFARIVEVARRTPLIRHWLPTREIGIVRAFLDRGRALPPNLTVRVSANLIDGRPPLEIGLPVSTVSREDTPVDASVHVCPQPARGTHQCGQCRACWDSSVAWVHYRLRD